MSDILSQDEIDKLLNAAASGGLGGPASSAVEVEELDQGEISQLAAFMNAVNQAANQTIATLIARPASVGDGRGVFAPPKELERGASVIVRAPFRSGFTGSIVFVMEETAAAALADLILGGDGAGKTSLAEGDDDAVKELMGQILGNAAPNMSAKAGTDVGFDSVTLKAVKAGSLAGELGESNQFTLSAPLTVEGVFDTRISLTMDGATSSNILEQISREPEVEQKPVRPVAFRESETMVRDTRGGPQPVPMYAPPPPEIRNIDLILDIEVEIMVRLGNSQMPLREIQKLRPGSIVDLDRDTDALVELVVNDRVIAKGELVVVSSDHFALRVTEIVTPTERIRSLGG